MVPQRTSQWAARRRWAAPGGGSCCRRRRHDRPRAAASGPRGRPSSSYQPPPPHSYPCITLRKCCRTSSKCLNRLESCSVELSLTHCNKHSPWQLLDIFFTLKILKKTSKKRRAQLFLNNNYWTKKHVLQLVLTFWLIDRANFLTDD